MKAEFLHLWHFRVIFILHYSVNCEEEIRKGGFKQSSESNVPIFVIFFPVLFAFHSPFSILFSLLVSFVSQDSEKGTGQRSRGWKENEMFQCEHELGL